MTRILSGDPVTVEAHGDDVLDLAFAPDGSVAYSASMDATVGVFSLPDWEPLGPLVDHERSVNGVAVTPDGEFLLSGSSDGTVRQWSLPGGDVVATVADHEDTVSTVAASPTGEVFASGSYDGTVRLWRLPDREYLDTLEHGGNVRRVAFSPDGAELVSAGLGDAARVRSVPDGELLRDLPGHGAAAMSVAHDSDGRVLTVGHDGRVHVWEGDRPVRSFDTGEDGQFPVAVAPDGSIAVGVDRGVALFDPDGTPVATHGLPVKGVYAVAFSPEGDLVAGCSDGRIRVWTAEKA